MKSFIILISAFFLTINAFATGHGHHGMLLFGGKSLYASHLPLYHQPHDFQMVLEVDLAEINEGSSVLAAYQAQKEEGQTLFTILPIAFNTNDVLNGNIKELPATLFSGHFEQGGEALGQVKMKIEEVVFHKALNPTDNGGSMNSAEFKVFGKNDELFMIHVVYEAPSYDAVLEVKLEITCSPRAGNCTPSILLPNPITLSPCSPRVDLCIPQILEPIMTNSVFSIFSNTLDSNGLVLHKQKAPEVGEVITQGFRRKYKVTKEIYSNYDELK